MLVFQDKGPRPYDAFVADKPGNLSCILVALIGLDILIYGRARNNCVLVESGMNDIFIATLFEKTSIKNPGSQFLTRHALRFRLAKSAASAVLLKEPMIESKAERPCLAGVFIPSLAQRFEPFHVADIALRFEALEELRLVEKMRAQRLRLVVQCLEHALN